MIDCYFVLDYDSNGNVEFDPLPAALKRMINLNHLKVAIYFLTFSPDLFEHMHHLVYREPGSVARMEVLEDRPLLRRWRPNPPEKQSQSPGIPYFRLQADRCDTHALHGLHHESRTAEVGFDIN